MTLGGFDCMVAAGGFGSRIGLGMPKCLLKMNGKSLLQINLEQATLAGCESIVVLCNNDNWIPEVRSICNDFPNVVFVQDQGFNSTFDLCRHYSRLMGDRFLFLYSHAPRSAELVSSFCQSTAQMFGSVKYSTRRDPIKHERRFIEPPFLLHKSTVLASSAGLWSQYFTSYSRAGRVHRIFGPGEFNGIDEATQYFNYLDRRLISQNARSTNFL